MAEHNLAYISFSSLTYLYDSEIINRYKVNKSNYHNSIKIRYYQVSRLQIDIRKIYEEARKIICHSTGSWCLDAVSMINRTPAGSLSVHSVKGYNLVEMRRGL